MRKALEQHGHDRDHIRLEKHSQSLRQELENKERSLSAADGPR
jgi:hypothetical protein